MLQALLDCYPCSLTPFNAASGHTGLKSELMMNMGVNRFLAALQRLMAVL
jgi:hypothetical protein